jgi:hypothetical protein
MWPRKHADESNSPTAGVARNMLDAVSYLIWIASQAGLESIATKLSAVRIDLAAAAYESPDHVGVRDQSATTTHDTGQKARKSHAAKTH